MVVVVAIYGRYSSGCLVIVDAVLVLTAAVVVATIVVVGEVVKIPTRD